MVDQDTLLKALVVYVGSKDALNKLLGPTADYLGVASRDFVRKCHENLGRILGNAIKRLGPGIELAGQVNARLLKQVYEEGSFTEDELAAEYFGGILASGRTKDGKDDRGLTYIAAVKELSVYQIRLHFIMYSALRELFVGKGLNVMEQAGRSNMELFLPFGELLPAILGGHSDNQSVLPHAIVGLIRHGLLAERWLSGPAEYLQQNGHPKATEGGVVLGPSLFGLELMLSVLGFADTHPSAWCDPHLQVPKVDGGIQPPKGALPARGLA